jgi:hypothetical protein
VCKVRFRNNQRNEKEKQFLENKPGVVEDPLDSQADAKCLYADQISPQACWQIDSRSSNET